MSIHSYGEASLGESAANDALGNCLRALGFEPSGPQKIRGRSGLVHAIDAVGSRKGNMVLVVSGGQAIVGRDNNDRSPKERVEQWCRDSLLRLYDVGAVMEAEGIKTDLLFFENARREEIPLKNPNSAEEWLRSNNLPLSIHLAKSWSVLPIETAPPRYISNIATSVDACYLSLQDMRLDEIAAISKEKSLDSVTLAAAMLKRLRVTQYFNPPTDELLLTVIGLAPNTKRDILPIIYESALKLAHEPAPNTIVPDTNYADPIATAQALESHNLISYEATVLIKDAGREITHRITKSPQESFVRYLLKTISLPEIAKAIVQAIKGGNS